MGRLVQLVLFITLINYSMCNCMEKVKRCDKAFQDELKAVKFGTADTEYRQIYYDICSNGGIYARFVNCIQDTHGECDSNAQFRKTICHTRAVKMNSYRYTWKANLIHDVCYRTSPIFDVEFFKHEKCIAKVLNAPRWSCDETHYKMVKQTNGPNSCPHWKEFRTCTFAAVTNECGASAANISDYLFHAHGSYFTKYTLCNATGEEPTKCWYDWLKERVPAMTTVQVVQMSSTTTTTTAPVPTTQAAQESNPSHAYSSSPSEHHTTFASHVDEHSTVESSSSWNKEYTTESHKESVHKKESSVDNDESSYMVVEDNSIHHEEKHDADEDDDDDKDPEHETEKVINETSESYEEKRKSRQKIHRTKPVGGSVVTVPSIPSIHMPELYLNDVDLKGNASEPSAQQMQKPVVRESKSVPSEGTPEASRKETINMASTGGHVQVAGSSAPSTANLSSLFAILFSLLCLAIFSV